MKITFVLPLSVSGGSLVIYTYGRALAARGHKVVFVSPPGHGTTANANLWEYLFDQVLLRNKSFVSILGEVEHRVLKRRRSVKNSDVPEADIVIATWWETAEWVVALNPTKGKKVYFVQGHEIYPWLPQRRCRATYHLPMQKIVISQWLKDIMLDSYGDDHVYLVPNGVDHELFFADHRLKQLRPTVGLLHSNAELKGFGVALEALTLLRQSIPDLRVLTFGFDAPQQRLPNFVEYVQNPPRQNLRAIYCQCDVWLTASFSEGFNLPAMEAMACRTPVVATRTGWPVEAIGLAKRNGALVDVGDVAALARETEKILKLPSEEWRRMSSAAFDTVRDCSWSRSVTMFEAALARIQQS